MAPVAKRLESGPQLYARLIAGEVQLKRGKPREAIASFQEAQKISDSWLGRFDLARAYLEAGEFDQAASEFDQCLRRRGEVTSVFLDDVPSYHFFPIIYYYQGRARQGLSHPDATESYRSFLSTREKGERDPIATDAKLRLASLTK
jgi:tetratricopeptide (TPR) repeat protein